MKADSIISALVASMALSACAASSDSIKLDNGWVVHSVRGGVDFGDCGTQQAQYLFDPANKFVTSHSERGEALHCPLLGAVIMGGSQVGSAALIANGVQRAAKAAANASNELTINNSNTNDAEGYYSGQQSLTQTQAQSLTGGAGGGSGGLTSGSTVTHGNNGFGNGGHDGSPNGKPDNNR